VYQLKKPKHVVVISNVYFEKFYPYFKKALPYIHNIIATNYAVKNYLDKIKVKSAEVIIHPFSYPDHKKTKKENVLLWTHQWRNWKGIGDLCKVIKDLKCKVILYGAGREYYNWKDKLPSNAEYLGNVKPDEVLMAYARSKYSIDLTGRSLKYYGHHNRSTIEPMFFKCLSICNEKLIDPYSFIPQDVVLSVDRKNLANQINEVIMNNDIWKSKVNKAYDWAKDFYSDKRVIEQLCRMIK